jgi:hypothetical protein
MMVEAIYASTNPTCDMLNLYDQATLIARIHDQLWIEQCLHHNSEHVGTTANTFSMFHRRQLMNTVKNDTRGKPHVYNQE